MSYLSECSTCSLKETTKCPHKPVYDATHCPEFKEAGRLSHLSGPMKLIFYLYYALTTASILFSIVLSFMTPGVPLVSKIFYFLYLPFMIYAIITFIKPLPSGAFITKVLVGSALISNVILLVGLIIKGIYRPALGAAFILILTLLLFYFLIKDDELNFIFPKEKRKVGILDYLFAFTQLLSIAATILIVIFIIAI